MEDKLVELERRIEHLENELGTTYEQRQFELFAESIAPDGATTELKNDTLNKFVRVSDIDGDGVQKVINGVENRDEYEYAVTETGEGLAVEVWKNQ
jgi:hypothetical protein